MHIQFQIVQIFFWLIPTGKRFIVRKLAKQSQSLSDDHHLLHLSDESIPVAAASAIQSYDCINIYIYIIYMFFE